MQWGSEVAWEIASTPRHREALTDLYAKAGRTCLQQGGTLTTEELQRIAESAFRREVRPADVTKALLYDVAAIYLQACKMSVDCAVAATVVPMLLEEHLRSPQATGPELLGRWRLRVEHELDTYRPWQSASDTKGTRENAEEERR